MAVYNTWKNWGFWTLFIIWNCKRPENTTFRKLDLLPSSGEGRETPTHWGLFFGEHRSSLLFSQEISLRKINYIYTLMTSIFKIHFNIILSPICS
jgi:hypothetical protein